MTLNVSYMGTKRQLANQVSAVIENQPGGPLLDLFSGMCAIGEAVGTTRNVWANDVQIFASTVAEAFFRSDWPAPRSIEASELILKDFSKNYEKLVARFLYEFEEEKKVLSSNNFSKIGRLQTKIPNVRNSSDFEIERSKLSSHPRRFPYRLFTITFAGGYFGLAQCIAIDSLRYAIDKALDECRISSEVHRWFLLALCQAVSKVATTTGHFAQFLTVKKNNKGSYIGQRKREIWKEWLRAIDDIGPIGSYRWRKGNKSFCNDALDLLIQLKKKKEKPSVIYADPPYTGDQYSRYYHLYETLILYDYPSVDSKGLYRSGRYSSSFSKKTTVKEAFEKLIKGAVPDNP
ncbi:MAG: DNA adenine methylase [Proteobacteria bacterium]|nr:DNA adenine methylase [Pseudomonadota bacterium]